ncbi:lytic transglycosylase domain-containing protein [Bradyrhizobium centrosematis]|uniref:lytic transglycosylase domain-containing protein n=1 Tax=Bradyrhizobium centrosematis TaxID=1300039 RepID=UPI00216A215A|nr:lytic transglycosylase domain-containing protein [Bradyrhizobium centrosematis]MCS3762636.1 soluble lytic murein transglycosylase-like protein [Bradyrhizobium centrosematis]MCS3775305.1 soluble lytic murein transglycosylase-like protein [Bradyrhizobium centrosematis]
MKVWQTSCIVAVIASAGLYLAAGNRPAAMAPDVMPEAAASMAAPASMASPANMVTPALYAEASARLAAALRSERAAPGSETSAGSRPSSAEAEIVDEPVAPKLASLGQDVLQPLPPERDASIEAPKAASTQDFRYLVYYVWSELPPVEKPAEIVLRAFKDIPVGTPAEEIKRASDAFGLDFNFMMAVAKIESGFNPNQRTGSYIGLFQLSHYEFGKFGFGQIRSPRDNAVAAAYKIITEGVQFGWITHRTPDMSDLYLIHQQGWEGAAEHISKPARLAWKSMCASSEGKEKGERWCKRAIWGNALPAFKRSWKSVENVTSEAFVGMWRGRVAEFYGKYVATAAAAASQ